MTAEQPEQGLDGPPDKALQKPANSENPPSSTALSRAEPESVSLANSVLLSDTVSETEVCDQAVTEPPREGTLAWLQLQEHIDFHGLSIPAIHRLPEGSELGEPNGHCRLIRPDGSRCRAPATRSYGICLVHLGGGMQDALAASQAAHRSKAKLRMRRELLGIGPARAASPRQIARLAAHERAEEIAAALVDGPLDDPDLGSLARQTAVIRALDATYPIQTATVELELPAEPEQLAAMSWQDMQSLAARLLGET